MRYPAPFPQVSTGEGPPNRGRKGRPDNSLLPYPPSLTATVGTPPVRTAHIGPDPLKEVG